MERQEFNFSESDLDEYEYAYYSTLSKDDQEYFLTSKQKEYLFNIEENKKSIT